MINSAENTPISNLVNLRLDWMHRIWDQTLPEQSNPLCWSLQLQSPVFGSHLPFPLHSFGHFSSEKIALSVN